MPAIAYVARNFGTAALGVIGRANGIIDEYQRAGYSLTLRQLYYQFVARGYIANRQSEYSRLGTILSDARLAGLVDWLSIEDRTRWLRAPDTDSGSPQEHLRASAQAYAVSRWDTQPYAPEVWIEKDALVGIVQSVCDPLYVPYFACRGYVSQSEAWLAGQRMVAAVHAGKVPIIFHLGDHDPSGIDMTRDLEDRLTLFCHGHGVPAPDVVRLALNMDQVEDQQPPPNPTKLTDSRAGGYLAKYGDESWELDALDPTLLADLIRSNVEPLIDADAWKASEREEADGQAQLAKVATHWDAVAQHLEVLGRPPLPPQRDIDGNYR